MRIQCYVDIKLIAEDPGPVQVNNNVLMSCNKDHCVHWHMGWWVLVLDNEMYPQITNISGTLVGNIIVEHSDVVGASPVGAAPTTSSLSS